MDDVTTLREKVRLAMAGSDEYVDGLLDALIAAIEAAAARRAIEGSGVERCGHDGCGLEPSHPFHVPGHSTHLHPFTPEAR